MKPLYRFMILALVGFTLGAGIAYWQSRSELPAVQTEQEQVEQSQSDEAPVAAAETALNNAAEDVVAAPAPTASTETAELDEAADVTAETTADAHADHAEHAAAEGHHDHAAMMAEMEAAKTAAATAPAPVAGSTVGGAFALTDHNGQAVTNESWPGKHKLVFFGFTHCPDICPAALDKMTAALNTLGDKAKNVQPLFITIDPARDNAETMKAYLGNYHPSIVGLTGTEAQIKQVEEAYKVYAAKVDTGTPVYTMAHSSFVFLMSPDDELLEIYRDTDPADQMAEKIGARVAQ